MTRHVADAIEQIHAIANAAPRFYALDSLRELAESGDYLTPTEVEALYLEYLEAPGDDEADGAFYAMAVWDAVNEKWVDCAV